MSKATFGERVRALRNKQGMTQKYLAQKAHITSAYLKSIEDNCPVSPDIIDRLASALGTNPEYLEKGGTLLRYRAYLILKGI